jgi:Ca2+-binding RTX toxin-like protein
MRNFRTYRRGAAAVLGATGLAAAQLAMFGTAAQAAPPSSVFIDGGVLRVLSPAGQVNVIQLTPVGGTIVVTDTVNNLAGQFPCNPVNAHRVDCPAAAINSFRVETNDGNDQVRNFANRPGLISTAAGSDFVSDGPNNQTVLLGTGNDSALAGTGRDVTSGSTGIDTVSYSNRAAGVAVRLDNAANDGQAGEQDNVLSDNENITGSNAGDVLIGSAASNVIRGLGGNDLILALGANDFVDGGFGADNMFGGTGAADTVSYAGRAAAVTVRLDNLANDGQAGEGDNAHSDFEIVNGGNANDLLVGSAAANVLRGLGGNDLLIALGGNDLVDGGFGRDTMFGGTGIDTTTYSGRVANVVVRLDNLANDGQAGEQDNAVSDIENILGGGGNDILVGSAARNVLQGLNGNDFLFGLAGSFDLLIGGNGTDFGSGGAGIGDNCVTENDDATCEF